MFVITVWERDLYTKQNHTSSENECYNYVDAMGGSPDMIVKPVDSVVRTGQFIGLGNRQV